MAKSLAVVGASANRGKFSNKCVRAYLAAGWTVYPLNPMEAEIEGLPVYRTLQEVPIDHLDRVSFYLAPPLVLKVLPGFTGKTIGELWLNPGTESAEVLELARTLGLNVVSGCSIVDIGSSPSDFPE